MISAELVAWITLGVFVLCVGYALLRANYEKYCALEAASAQAIQQARNDAEIATAKADAQASAFRRYIDLLTQEIRQLHAQLEERAALRSASPAPAAQPSEEE